MVVKRNSVVSPSFLTLPNRYPVPILGHVIVSDHALLTHLGRFRVL